MPKLVSVIEDRSCPKVRGSWGEVDAKTVFWMLPSMQSKSHRQESQARIT